MLDNTSQPAIQRLIELQQLLLDFHAVDRQVFIPPTIDKAENDIAHSFSLAMLAWFLSPHFPELDANKMLRMCLAHDIVEVYAGDTFSYDDEAVLAKSEREAQAQAKLAAEWADFPELIRAIQEYEESQTPEAKFVYSLDKLQPAIMDYLNEGRIWRRLNITFSKFVAEKEKKMPVSPEVYKYYQQLRQILENKPHLFPSK
jgi:putative hydrolase of HD superfamily